MITPAARDAAVGELKKEGGQIPLGPKRAWWWKYVFVVLGLCLPFFGLRAWGSWRRAGAEVRAVEAVKKTDKAGPSSAPVQREYVAAPELRLRWVAGGTAGLVINGVEYAAQSGDVFDGVVVGDVGVQGIDVQFRGTVKRLRLSIPSDGSSYSGGGGAGREGNGGTVQGGTGKRFPWRSFAK